MALRFSFFRSASPGSDDLEKSGAEASGRPRRGEVRSSQAVQFVLLSTQGSSWLKLLQPQDLYFSRMLKIRNLASCNWRHLGNVASESVFGVNVSPKSLEVIWKF